MRGPWYPLNLIIFLQTLLYPNKVASSELGLLWDALGLSILLFNVYIKLLVKIIYESRVRSHQYADKTQL